MFCFSEGDNTLQITLLLLNAFNHLIVLKMDNNLSSRQPLGGRSGCILDDVDSVLDARIFGILRRAIKRWEKHANWEPSNASNNRHVWQNGPSQDEKQIKYKQDMQELDDAIQRLRKDLKLKHAVRNEPSTKEDSSELAIGESVDESTEVANNEEYQKEVAQRRSQIAFGYKKSSKQEETYPHQDEKQISSVKVSRKPPVASKKELPWIPRAPSHTHDTDFYVNSYTNEVQTVGVSDQGMATSNDAPTSNLSSSQTNAKLRDRMTNIGKTKTGISNQHSVIAQDSFTPEVKPKYLQRCVQNMVFKDRSDNVSFTSSPTRKVDHTMTTSPKRLPPKGFTSADRRRYVPSWKLDFDIKETTTDGNLQDVHDIEDKKENSSPKEKPISSVAGVSSSSPLCVSVPTAGKSSKGQWDMNESINMFSNTSQIRYDAIKVIAEIQMNDLKESFLDWQKRFLAKPFERRVEVRHNM